jgi:hypothetical protein
MSEKLNRNEGGRKTKMVKGNVSRIRRGSRRLGTGRVGESLGLMDRVRDIVRAGKK